eukprot:729155-Prymnesium_polylepis.1
MLYGTNCSVPCMTLFVATRSRGLLPHKSHAERSDADGRRGLPRSLRPPLRMARRARRARPAEPPVIADMTPPTLSELYGLGLALGDV